MSHGESLDREIENQPRNPSDSASKNVSLMFHRNLRVLKIKDISIHTPIATGHV